MQTLQEAWGPARQQRQPGGGVSGHGHRSEADGPGPDGRALAGTVVGNLVPVFKEAREGLNRRVP